MTRCGGRMGGVRTGGDGSGRGGHLARRRLELNGRRRWQQLCRRPRGAQREGLQPAAASRLETERVPAAVYQALQFALQHLALRRREDVVDGALCPRLQRQQRLILNLYNQVYR